MKKIVLLTFGLCILSVLNAANHYWIGGSGAWNNSAHWSLSSGGPGGASIPTLSDDVFFDASSFSLAKQTVMITEDAECHSIDWTSIGDQAIFSCASTKKLKIFGSYRLSPQLLMGFKGQTIFASSNSGNQIFTYGRAIIGDYIFNGSGSWILMDDIYTEKEISHLKGSLNTNGKTIHCGSFIGNSSLTRTLTLSNSEIFVQHLWDFSSPANLAFDAGTSRIIFKDSLDNNHYRSGGLIYNSVSAMAAACSPSGTPCGTFTITLTGTNVTCNGACNGTATIVSVTGGSGSFSYFWSPPGGIGAGQGTTNVTGLCAGTYTVRVTDNNTLLFCFCSIAITEPGVLFDFELMNIMPLCNGQCNGSAAVDATGGTPPYSYVWSAPSGATNDTALALCAATYTVTVTDVRGCTGNTTVVVSEPAVLTAPGSSTNVTCFGFCDGTASVVVAGGTPPYFYNWTGTPVGDGTPNITNLCPGSYTCVVTDANGCTTNFTAVITQPPILTVAMSQTNASCGGICDGTATVTITGGTSPYNYVWSNGSSTLASASLTNTISALCAGPYSVQVTDANGCTLSGNVTITEPTLLTALASGVNITCFGLCNGTATVVPSGGTAGYSFAWTGPGAFSANTQNISGLCAGVYNVTVTDANGCTATSSVTIIEPPALVAGFSSTNVTCFSFCNGTATALPSGGTPGYSYNWLPGNPPGDGTPNIGPLCPNTYSYVLTDANGCTLTSANIVITEPPVLNAGATSTNVTCNSACDGTATASPTGGTPGYTYAWSTGASTPGITLLCPATYTVTVTDANGCTSIQTVTLTQPNNLSVSIVSSTLLCNGDCNATATATVVGGTAGYTFSWTPDPPTPVGQGTNTISSLCAGVYTVNVIDANGCPATANTTITQPTALTLITATSDASCNGICDGTAAAIAGGGTPAYGYSWAPVGLSTPNITSQCAGSYTVTLTDANGCQALDTVVINEPAVLLGNPTVVNNVSCAGMCDGSAESNPTGGTAPYGFNWSPASPSGDLTDSIFNLCAGIYSVVVTDANSCTSTQSVTITQPLVLSAPITGATSSCNVCNGTATVTPAGGTAPYGYAWSDGQSTPTAVGLCPNTTYTVTITDANGCQATNTVTITQTVVITITTSNTTLSCAGACDGTATANPSGGAPPYSYLWTGPGPGFPQFTQTIINLCAGSYTVTVSDANGCFNTDSVTFTDPPALTISAVSTNASCSGVCDGTATATGLGGTGALTYSWLPGGQTTATAVGLCANTYNVTVTDGNGCTAVTSVTITEPPTVVDNATVTDANCLFADGMISVVPTGGAGAGTYTFNWGPGLYVGEPSATITNLFPGAYTLVITSGGCSYNFNYILNNIAGPTLVMAHTDVSCFNACDGTATVVASGGAGGYIYDWTPGVIVGDGTPAVTNLCGTATYTLTVTDVAGCITIDTAQIINPTLISPNPTIVNESCGGACDGSITLAPTGGTGPYTFSWSTGATTPIISGLCASGSPYTFTVTDANGCDTTLSITITSPPTLTVVLDSTNVTCNSACDGTATAVVAGGTGALTYAWSHGAAFVLPNVVFLCAGTYSVTVTDANGCTAIDDVNITEPVALTSFTTQTNVSCNSLCDGMAFITAAGGTLPYSYLWNPGAIGNDTASGLCAGLYNATVTDVNGCVSSPPGITITQPAPIVPTATFVNPTCNSSCNGTAIANPTGGSPGFAGYIYSWVPGGATQNISGLCAGNYDVTVTDSLGCSNTQTITLVDPITLNANTSFTSPTCSGGCDGSATSTPVGGTPGYTYSWTPVISALPTVPSLCAGNYQVIVNDANGCADTQTVAVINPPGIDVIVGGTPANCGACDGTITVSPITGTPSYTYVWTISGTATPPPAPFTGNGTANVSNVCAGLYDVLVTDANGCDSLFTIPMNNSSGPTGETVIITNATCNGVCNGAASVTPIGGIPPYTFLWNDGPPPTAIDTAFGLCAGNYFVQVTDASGCIHFSPVTITEPLPILANGVITSAVCSSVCTGAITVTPSGGTPGYTYVWAPAPITGQGTPTVTGLCPGTYTLTITDANLCTAIDSFVVGQSTPLNATIAATNISCSSTCNGMAYVTITSGTGPFTIQWNDPMGQTNDTATALCAGNYTVDITDALGCTNSLSITITATPPVSANAVITDATCGLCDGQAVLTPSGGTAPYTYLWSNADTAATADSLCSGLYTVNITDGSGCITTVAIPVNNTSEPTSVVFTSTNISCFGLCDGTVTAITPSGGLPPYTFLWIASGQTTAAINSLCSGVYYVQITDANGCSLMDSVTITEPSQIVANQVVTAATCGVCDGGITIAPSGGLAPYTIVWSPVACPGCLTISSLCADVYSVQITDANACTQNIIIPINNFNGPSLSTSATNATCNASCNGIVGVDASGGLAPYTFLWNDVAAQTTDTTTATLCAGTYFVQVTGADGCISISSATVTEPPVIGFSVANTVDPLCNGTSNGAITTIPSGGTLSYTYAWSPAPALGQTTATVTALSANTYTVTVTDANGCSSTQTIILTNPISLTISDVATNSSCNTIPDGAIDITVGGGTLPYSYQWSGGCSVATTEDLVGLLAPCTYIMTVTDSNSCTIADTINLTAAQSVIAMAGNDTTFCQSGSLTLNACASTNGVNYQWSEMPGNTSVGNTCSVSVNPPSGVTSYYVSVDNGTGCISNDTIIVTSNPSPNVDAGPDQTIVIGGNIGIGGSPTTSTSGTSIIWTPSLGLSSASAANPTATPTATTIYTVTITSAQGCTSTDSMVVTVLPTIVIPDGISPNADGINDEWIIDGIDIFPNCNVEVYNRWGELLFQSPGYKEHWDGTYKNQLLPVGTYYYIIDLGDPLFPDAYTGPITLMR